MNNKRCLASRLLNYILPSPFGEGLGVRLLFLLAISMCACSSNDDDNNDNTPSGYTVEAVSQAPAWHVDYSGSESRPDWQEPNPANYENWATLLLQVEDELKAYATDDDLLALFVGDELRGLSGPARMVADGEENVQNGEFILKAFGNEADQNVMSVTLSYYCSQLKQTFTRTVQMKYDMGKVYGLDEDLIPQFTLGSAKYPVVTYLTLTAADLAPIDATFASGDMLAAFVGNECRGILYLNDQTTNSPNDQTTNSPNDQTTNSPNDQTTNSPNDQTTNSPNHQLTVFGRQEGEAYTLKYYNAATQRVYTLSKAF